MITKKYYKLIRVSYEDSEYFRLKNISNETGVFQMKKQGSPTAPNLEYSLDGVTWTTYDFTNLPEVPVLSGANIYFRGTNANQQFNKQSSNYVYFSFSKTCEGHGNLCSLFDTDPTVFSAITSIGQYGLYSAFQGCTSLTQAPDLSNVTSIGDSGLNSAFQGCTSLTQAPDLSNVTSIGNYGLAYAFQGCTSLTQAPDLSNVTSIGTNGLQQAFSGCTSLTQAPDLSNVTSIGTNGLNYAFRGCTSLTQAPDLSNVTSIGDSGLYSAFRGCTSLTQAPDLSNVTSIGDSGLNSAFQGCTSLTQAPDLSNVTSIGTNGLQQAFYDCTHLETATAPNISDLTVNNILQNWLYNAGGSATGTKTVRVPTGATIATDSTSGIPTGFVRVDY